MLGANFLIEDQEAALKELVCIADCLQLMTMRIQKGQFNAARLHIEDIDRSLQELAILKNNRLQRKSDIDVLFEELSDLGVDVHYVSVGERG
ncbi:hypothetical protein OEV98_11175 [Caldibacillus lycopersici]|uniref:Uncharacterized protein n=1 Tax=Perspicuibacillus lycopersici TaxID=1325689 RepID=A0AAE3ITJ2_9BACI|nr:hypothetical protein [Perspicuibacillus lycopersici]MCU9614122.1 hypothetical protein [Perspicuibacillus lycopersici]